MAVLPPRPAILRRLAGARWVDLGPLVLGGGATSGPGPGGEFGGGPPSGPGGVPSGPSSSPSSGPSSGPAADLPSGPAPGLPILQARAWALVLAAARVPHKLASHGRFTRVLVPSWAAPFAAEEVRRWRAENPAGPEAAPVPDAAPAVLPDVSAHASFWPTLLAMLALVGFHFYVQAPHPGPGPAPEVWLDAGTAQAGRILQGQWWRLVTALTLHADAAHVLGNAVFGGLFAGLLCRRVGSGLGWLLILLAGAAGNGCNALVAAPWHDSLGFSTALFGAAGALSGLNLRRGSLSRAAAPLAAALGILAMLGAGGEDPGLIDLGAHGFGLAAGLGLGAGAGFVLRRRGLPGRAADAVLGLLALGMVVGCWGLALRALPA